MILQDITVQELNKAREVIHLQQKKNEETIRLLKSWLADDSGYDEKTWPVVKEAMEENRLSSRRRFHD